MGGIVEKIKGDPPPHKNDEKGVTSPPKKMIHVPKGGGPSLDKSDEKGVTSPPKKMIHVPKGGVLPPKSDEKGGHFSP